jgi:hypothetical protein
MNTTLATSVDRLRPAPGAVAATAAIPWGFAEWFIISQTALPALLYLPGTQVMRLPLRFAAFAISLAALAWWQLQAEDESQPHPAYPWVVGTLVLLAVMLFHPTTASLTGGLAHMMVYVAVIAPFFWVPGLVRTPEHLARLLAILLICSGINSAVGVLQVYDPARWMPTELSRVITQGAIGLGPVTYIGPDGRVIIRPPGLFDTPGAVAGPGMYAALLGVVFGLSALPLWQRVGAFAASGAGLAAIYLSQVRVSFVVLLVMAAVYVFVLLRQGRIAKATTFGTMAGGLLVGSFLLAIALGGDSILARFTTLFAEDPMAVYYRSRGVQLDHTLTEMLFEFPFGAGLGRWGMAAGYFGTASLPGLWAEIQVTGWVIDGGILLVVLYGGALAVNAVTALRLALATHHVRLAACAAVVLAANLGVAVMIISFTPFVSQIGIQYWFLVGALHGVVRNYRRPVT